MSTNKPTPTPRLIKFFKDRACGNRDEDHYADDWSAQDVLDLVEEFRTIEHELVQKNEELNRKQLIAERCFSVEQCEQELFDEVHKILGGDSDQCLEPGFVWEVTNTTTDSYDGSIEVIRPEGRPPMTRQQADAILALGFGIVFESIGETGRCITAKSDGPCSVHKGDGGLHRKRLKSELAKLRGCLKSIIDGCVHPETAHRRAMVDLGPIRKVLNETDLETKTPPQHNHGGEPAPASSAQREELNQ